MSKYNDFLKNHPVKKFKKGSVIIHQGDVPTAVHVVKSGFVKVYNINSSGDEKPVLFDITFEAFPTGWMFDRIRKTYFYYEALTDVEAYLVPKKDYQDYLRNEPNAMWRALDYYADRHVNYQLRMHALEQSKAREKILFTFEFMIRRYGRATSGDNVHIDLPLTQQDFANYVGLTRETVSQELSKLQDEKIITYANQHYEVSKNRLQKLLDEV